MSAFLTKGRGAPAQDHEGLDRLAAGLVRDSHHRGFGHVPNQVHSAPAKHLETATLHMVNYIGTMQGEFAGAQAFSHWAG